MTEASGSESLARVLALLPEDLASRAVDWLRRSGEIAAGATSVAGVGPTGALGRAR
jgi:hypothetical protein